MRPVGTQSSANFILTCQACQRSNLHIIIHGFVFKIYKTGSKKLQKYGIGSPSRIIKNRVVTEAKRLLMYTDKSVKEIASIIGCDDQFYFSSLFAKEGGISPGEYKKSCLKS